MLRLSLFLILLRCIRTAYITDQPSFADRLDRLYEKLEKFTIAPIGADLKLDAIPDEKLYSKIDKLHPEDKLYAKLDRLKSLGTDLSDEDEELLSAMQLWGMLSADQLDGVVKELQMMKEEPDVKSERMTDGDYGDSDWNDEDQDLQDLVEGDYPMDEWDGEYTDSSTAKPGVVTPSAFTKLDTFDREVLSAVDPIAATNERPRILDDSALSSIEKNAIRRAALGHISTVVRGSKCQTPQPRWLSVRQLAPAADTVYMPPCVQLHRCAPDSGCCYNEAEVCAPVDGKYITVPFMLNKADGNFTQARILFFNHTRCACVSRETLQSTRLRFPTRDSIREASRDQIREPTRDPIREPARENDMHHDSDVVRRDSTAVGKAIEWRSTKAPILEKDEEPTAPPQLRRCTCPGLFLARISDSGDCTCVCEWPELTKRRDCLCLARGREHFGLRDRVCVAHGDCNPPSCEYGAYERSNGRCPLRRFRRVRYQRRYHDRSLK